MCAIIDANVSHEVFSRNRPDAGFGFFEWLMSQRGHLVAGGRLLEELERTGFEEFALELQSAGRLLNIDDEAVDECADRLRNAGACRSNDPHVIALAQVSGARLLYSNDKALHQDFRNSSLIDRPRGRIYSTVVYRHFHDNHRRLLLRRDLCAVDRRK